MYFSTHAGFSFNRIDRRIGFIDQVHYMPFNSGQFALFFSLFFFFYWRVFNFELIAQNLFLLLASYVFYAWWDWRFLFLLVGLSVLTYFLGIFIYSSTSEKEERVLLFTGLGASLGGLLFFKYFN